jgi:hypothetical protein
VKPGQVIVSASTTHNRCLLFPSLLIERTTTSEGGGPVFTVLMLEVAWLFWSAWIGLIEHGKPIS